MYLFRGDATKASKIKDEGTFWHRMGDLGYLDDKGALYFCGRKAHAVEYKGRNYYSVPVEKIFNTHPWVKRSALVKLTPSGEVAIVVEPNPQHWPEDAATRNKFLSELQSLGAAAPIAQGISRFFFHRSFPVDARHNAKIFRDRLGEWASKQ